MNAMHPSTHFRHRTARPRGLTLVEVTISTLIVGCLIVAALQSVGNISRTWTTTSQLVDGQGLAQDLLREILAQPYSDPQSSGVTSWGRESGETNRTTFDDIDDYDDWTESPVKNAAGVALPGYTGWSRSVVVNKRNTWDYTVKSDNSTDTGLRSVTVTATSPAGKKTTLVIYRSNDAGTQQSLSTTGTTVNWVGCNLKLGTNAPSTMSVSISNHAEDQ